MRRLARRSRLPAPLLVLLVLGSVLARAEAAATQQKTYTVQSVATVEQSLSGSAVRDLEMGTLTPGVPQTVAPQNMQSCPGCVSGLWVFPNLSASNSPSTRYLRITFVDIPTALAGPAGATLALNWTNGARGCLSRSGTEFYCVSGTPVAGGAYSYPINGPQAPPETQPGTTGRDMYLYLGGTGSPVAGQRAGNYVGSVTVRFEYSSF